MLPLALHSFYHDEALACESAGYFYLELGEKDTAIQYFLQAHEKYHDWGAVAKSNALFEFVQRALGGSPSPSPTIVTSGLPVVSISSPYINGNSGGGEDNNRRKRGCRSD